MKTIKQIKLFISCPGDIKEEIESISLIVAEINKTAGRQNGYILDALNWKIDTYTDIGNDPQEVINKQLEGQYDILIGLLWTRAGTATKRDKSGTIEEINRAIKNSKELLIYFKTSPVQNIYELDFEQFQIVKSFREELSNRGVLYKEYDTINSFEQQFRINITNLILEKIINLESKIIPEEISNKKYAEYYNLIEEIETKDDKLIDLDAALIIDEGTQTLKNLTFSLKSLSNSISFFGDIFRAKTSEINKHNQIKDNALRKKKILSSINNLAEELNEFNKRVEEELPRYSENFNLVGKNYSQILLLYPKNSDEAISLKTDLKSLRDNIDGSMNQIASLLKTTSDFPPVNSKFNRSKRETEIVIKNIMKITLDGLVIIDSLLEE